MPTATKNSKTAPTTEDLAAQVETLKADIATLTKTLSNYGKSQGRHLAEVAKDGVHNARQKGEEQFENLKGQAADLSRQAEDFVSERPAVSLGIAAGAGFLVGMLTARR